jgi:hypothetical protein
VFWAELALKVVAVNTTFNTTLGMAGPAYPKSGFVDKPRGRNITFFVSIDGENL